VSEQIFNGTSAQLGYTGAN